MTTESWEVWYPKAGPTGLLLGRGIADETPEILLHSAPEFLTVEVRDSDGNRLAIGEELGRTLTSPMCLLRRSGSAIVREDIWPSDANIGTSLMMPGGEFGVLKGWQHSEDRKQWRFQVEFFNAMDSGVTAAPAVGAADTNGGDSGNGDKKRPAFMGATKNGSNLD